MNPYQLAWRIWRQDFSWHTSWWLLGKVTRKLKRRLWSYFNRPEPDVDTLTGVLDEQGMPLPWRLLDRLYGEIDKTYYLRNLDSRGVLFRTAELDGKQAAYAPDEALGWENLFIRGLEIIPIAGDHYSIWGEQIPTIAREIDRMLKQRPLDHDDKVSIDASKP